MASAMMRFFKFASVCRKASAALLLIGWVGVETAATLAPSGDGLTAGGAVRVGIKTAVLVGSRTAMWMVKAAIASKPTASSNDKYRPAKQAHNDNAAICMAALRRKSGLVAVGQLLGCVVL